MRTFKVIALSVAARNLVLKSGDVVNEDAFEDGHADNLVKAGFLRENGGKEDLIDRMRKELPEGLPLTEDQLNTHAGQIERVFQRDPQGAKNLVEFFEGVAAGDIKVELTAEEQAEFQNQATAAGMTEVNPESPRVTQQEKELDKAGDLTVGAEKHLHDDTGTGENKPTENTDGGTPPVVIPAPAAPAAPIAPATETSSSKTDTTDKGAPSKADTKAAAAGKGPNKIK